MWDKTYRHYVQEHTTHIVTVPLMSVRFVQIGCMKVRRVIAKMVSLVVLVMSKLVMRCQRRKSTCRASEERNSG